MSKPILELDGVSMSFGALSAVDHVSLAVPKGRLCSIIGPNGAGKSTLFNLISGTMPPQAGSVRFNGTDVTAWPPHRRLHLGMARSFQITNLFGELTALENVRLACQSICERRYFLSRLGAWRDPDKDARAILETFGLDQRAYDRARDLSHGDQRRLEIAVCVGARPKLLLLDEPTQGMGREETEATDALIRSLLGETTILLVEHDVELVMAISDLVVVMHQGRIIAQGPPTTVRDDPVVREAYLGDLESADA